MLDFSINVLQQGLIFSIMVLGVYITYKILDFPDLSVDGSFVTGAAICAALLPKGINPIIVCLVAFAAGTLAGLATGILHVKLKITNLLSGILVMIGLYSINLRIMGKSNIPLFNETTLFSNGIHPLVVIAIIAVSSKLLLDFLLSTKLGFLIVATGDNPDMVTSLGIDTGKMKILALMLSNGLVALSGAVMAQYQRFSDVGMGTGIVVMGLASIIFGEAIFKRLPFIIPTTMALLGSIMYRLSIGAALRMGLSPTDLKLVTCIIIVAALSAGNLGQVKGLKSIFSKGGLFGAKTKRSVQNIQ
ncbi:putative ABC transport system permease protein [Peptoclostridium litorale DSM 5388]|uniref:Amino acid or sugar ABC transport system, permease protein n=1 Tax=Peptoclostridium litorale DSM 5388 TaxID=1121324 RepID=A0A069REL6_PEPLI|nr:hypothetical protein [Peptoclostridium litorale]KDR94610.1 amino acid or sugar ABC transport system, permease protein [Peptoclostridium litorale DSM 5388]SIO32107.1 putative ABC transport system permease protein [Peptoclostridium litorale DSM 5388]